MHPSLRNVITAGFWVSVIMGLAVPGCANRLGPVRATQSGGSTGHANLPDIVVERSKECVELYGQQLAPGRVVVESTVEVDEDGDKVGVNLGGLSENAPDFGACLRNVLHDMPIAERPFREAIERLKFHRKHASDGQEALAGFIELIPGVPIVESELQLEAGEYTVVHSVTVKVRPKLETFIDGDKRILAKIGQLALDSVGYEAIMTQAEQLGWVKRVPAEQARSATSKQFLGDGATAVAGSQLLQKFTEYAIKAGIASQVDSPAPGPGDAVAVGILVVGLIHVGILATEEILAERERCRQVNEVCQQKCLPQLKSSDFGNRFHRCMRQCREAAGCWKVLSP